MLKKTSFKPFNNLAILSLILLTSCLANKPSNQATEIRIVDLNGNPKPIKRMIPEGNAQMLASQQSQFTNTNDNIATTSVVEAGNINDVAPQNYPTPNTNQTISNNIAPPAENIAANSESKTTEAAVLYDMSNDATSEVKTATIPTPPQPASTSNKKFKLAISKTKSTTTNSANKSDILVQIGAFSSYSNAQKTLEQSKQISAGKIEEVDLNGKKNYRVFLGPISNSQKARNILKKAKNSGYKDAFIVR